MFSLFLTLTYNCEAGTVPSKYSVNSTSSLPLVNSTCAVGLRRHNCKCPPGFPECNYHKCLQEAF
jgi:hypothetical protein